jgi:YVTN family beta-propeller protein
MDYRILGPLEIADNGSLRPLTGTRQRALLTLLLLHRNEVVSPDRLIDGLWGASPPSSAAKALQNAVSQVRRALADGGGPEAGPLRTEGGGYVLRVAPEEVDADRFEALLAEGRRRLEEARYAVAAERLREALALWRGPALADVAYEAFAQPEIARLEEERLAALEERIDADLALGRHDELVAELESLVAENPYRERLQGQLLLALYRSGRQAEALDAYRRARRTFADELGIDPGPRLQELERSILRHDTSLEAPAPPPPPIDLDQQRSSRAELHPSRPRKRALAGVVGVVVLVIAAALVAALRDNSRTAQKPVVLTGDSVAVIDPATNLIIDEVPVGARPSGIAEGEGSIWVANRDDNTLLRIDPRSRTVVRIIGLAVEPREVAVAGQSVWVASQAGDAVLRVDPGINEVVGRISLGQGREVCCGLDLATGGGAIWVSYHGRLSRIDAATHTVETRRDGGVKSIAFGHGALWVMTATSRIERIDPDTNSVLDRISLSGVGQTNWGGAAVAVGAGAVWTSTDVTKTLWKIDPATGEFSGRVRLGRPAVGVAFGEGAVWVVGNDGTLLRVDPKSERVVRTIRLGVYAAQESAWAPVAVGQGAVWVPVTR